MASRIVHHGDGLEYLQRGPMPSDHALVTSLPDHSELRGLGVDGWRRWFVETVELACRAVADDAVAIFYQSDVKHEGRWIDKGHLVMCGADAAGTPIHVSLLQPFSQSAIAIPVKMLASAPKNTNVTIDVVVKGDYTCDDAGVALALTVRTGADEVPGASATDRVETFYTPWTPTGDGAAELWGRAYDIDGNATFHAIDANYASDTQFVSPALQVSATDPFVVAFDHAYAFEATYDGGVIEVSTDGDTWQDVTTFGVTPGYGAPLQIGGDNALEGRPAFTGKSSGYPTRSTLTLDFGTQLAGQQVWIRFRVGTDFIVGAAGWNIDNIAVSGITNTPFPALAAEPSTCSAPTPRTVQTGIVGTKLAPAVSLSAFDAGVCIANDL